MLYVYRVIYSDLLSFYLYLKKIFNCFIFAGLKCYTDIPTIMAMMDLDFKKEEQIKELEKRLETIQDSKFYSGNTGEWSSEEKRLFSICYWSLLKLDLPEEISVTGRYLNQRQLSLLITSDREGIKPDPNFIAKLIRRNTFPSEELASQIQRQFPSGRVSKDKTVPRFLSLSKETRYSILAPFIAEEERKASDVYKEIEETIKTLNEFQLLELRGYLAHMTGKTKRY